MSDTMGDIYQIKWVIICSTYFWTVYTKITGDQAGVIYIFMEHEPRGILGHYIVLLVAEKIFIPGRMQGYTY